MLFFLVLRQGKTAIENHSGDCVDGDANVSVIRPARWLDGRRMGTRLIARFSRMRICEDCSFSSGTNLITMFNFLSTLQKPHKIVRFNSVRVVIKEEGGARITIIMQRRSQADQSISLEISWTRGSTDHALGCQK